ncbi:MAG: HNH endonuclease [Planctomycetota bacterium]
MRNGGGRPEVEAAHIVPVSKQGPDVVTNGLALSGTVHWMFDRGLLAVDMNFSILIAKEYVDDDVTQRLIHPSKRLIVPESPLLRPHPQFLQWHRENCFKG